MYEYNNQIRIEEDDQCYDCDKLKTCPFIEALNMSIAFLDEAGTSVTGCQWHTPRRLRLVETPKSSDITTLSSVIAEAEQAVCEGNVAPIEDIDEWVDSL